MAATEEATSTNGGDPRAERPRLEGETFNEKVEKALLELMGGQHAIATEQSLYGKRLARVEANVDMLVRVQRQQGVQRASEAPPPMQPQPMRPPMPSGHFDDLDADLKSEGGTRVLMTKAQLDEHVRRAIDGWSVEKETHSELTTYRTIKSNLGAWAKGGVGAVIAAGFVAAWLWFKHFVTSEIHGPGGH
jgi:hypothetical protein